MPEPIRVLHIGDVHLGVELYGRPVPDKGYGTRVEDFLKALDTALAMAKDADLVVFPGDIYKNCDPTPTLQREFGARIRAAALQAPVVLIPGNHDLPQAFGRASSIDIFTALQVDNVFVLREARVKRVETRRGPVLIAPLPFTPRSRLLTLEEAKGKSIGETVGLMRDKLVNILQNLAGDVETERSKIDPATPAILMAHYTVQGAEFGGYGRGGALSPEVDLPVPAVRNPAWDYVALSHIHQHQLVPKKSHGLQPPIVYAGSIERVDFGEEAEDKVVVLAEVARGHTEWRPVTLNARPFVTIRVPDSEIDAADPTGSAMESIRKRAERAKDAVVRVQYSLPAGAPNLSERDVRAALEGAHYVAGIRRESARLENRARNEGLTTQLGPIEALEEYLKTQPQLHPLKDDMLARGRELVARLNVVDDSL